MKVRRQLIQGPGAGHRWVRGRGKKNFWVRNMVDSGESGEFKFYV